MRLKVIIPVSITLWNEGVQALLGPWAQADTELDVISLRTGPESLEFSYDEAYAQLPTIREAERAEADGYDGVIIYCFADPALAAVREKLTIPVVGLCESSVHVASLLGERFSIILAGSETEFLSKRSVVFRRIERLGLSHKCASIRTLGTPVLALETAHEDTKRRLLRTAKAAVEEDGADCVVLGCGGILVSPSEIQELDGARAIIPGLAALGMCEVLVAARLAHSKQLYPLPGPKNRSFPVPCDGYASREN